MKRFALACVAIAASFAAQAGTNPVGRATGQDRALARMNAQALAHRQANPQNPVQRPATPAIPATPAVPGANGQPATPAIPATPARPPKPPKED
jgi:hypothetical protein